ncbi:hypothetical protein HDE78_001502 [Rhodanobacter sp. K2T2]|nr:hypothetical protein [Rhodanobacter sp. K2T2]
MDFFSQLTPDVRKLLFGQSVPGDAYVSEVVLVSSKLDFIGLTLRTGVQFVLAFMSEVELATDIDFARNQANSWAVFLTGHQLDPTARTVKLFRADASHSETRFSQTDLGSPRAIWDLQGLLTRAVVSYTQNRPLVKQFFFIPASEALERWYDRLSRDFCRPSGALSSGIVFRRIACPKPGEGGFYGYERI